MRRSPLCTIPGGTIHVVAFVRGAPCSMVGQNLNSILITFKVPIVWIRKRCPFLQQMELYTRAQGLPRLQAGSRLPFSPELGPAARHKLHRLHRMVRLALYFHVLDSSLGFLLHSVIYFFRKKLKYTFGSPHDLLFPTVSPDSDQVSIPRIAVRQEARSFTLGLSFLTLKKGDNCCHAPCPALGMCVCVWGGWWW